MFTSGFFNSINGDRKYSSEQMSQLFDGLITDGIFMTVGGQMMITADADMTVILETGRAWFNHTWSLNETRMPLDLQPSSDIYDRIDAIVLEVNSDVSTRSNSIKILKGESAETNPVRPTLEKSYYVHQYPLAYISIPKRTKEITQSLITNMVGTSETPFVTGVIQGMNIDALVAQWLDEWSRMVDQNQEDFDIWFEDIKGKLAGDIAGNLQNRIDEQAEALAQAQQNIANLQTSLDAYKSLTEKDINAALSLAQNASGLASSAYDLAQVANNGLSGKQNTITGGVSTGVSSNYTGGRAMVSNSEGKLVVSSTTATELSHLSGVSSNVQTQLSNKLPINPSSIEIYSSAEAYIDFHPNGTKTDYRTRIIDDGAHFNLVSSAGSSTSFLVNGKMISTLESSGASGSWRYIKFTSGLAICFHEAVCPGNFANNSWGNGIYYSSAYIFSNFPFSFAVVPSCMASITVADPGYTTISLGIFSEPNATLTKPPRFWCWRQGSQTIGHPYMNLTVIGRWK